MADSPKSITSQTRSGTLFSTILIPMNKVQYHTKASATRACATLEALTSKQSHNNNVANPPYDNKVPPRAPKVSLHCTLWRGTNGLLWERNERFCRLYRCR